MIHLACLLFCCPQSEDSAGSSGAITRFWREQNNQQARWIMADYTDAVRIYCERRQAIANEMAESTRRQGHSGYPNQAPGRGANHILKAGLARIAAAHGRGGKLKAAQKK